MASMFLASGDGSLEDDSWFQDEAKEVIANKASVPPSPAAVVSQGSVSAAAWKDWSRPTLNLPTAPVGKVSASNQKYINQQAAIAMHQLRGSASSQDGAEAMASRSAASLAMTKANTVLKKSGLQLAPGLIKNNQVQMRPVAEVSHPEPTQLKEQKKNEDQADQKGLPNDDDAIIEQPAKKQRGKKGEVGCFAGNRPPTGEDQLAIFNLKKELFNETREELMRKYPGKHILVGKTVNQFDYWAHVRKHLKKKFTNIDCKKPASRPSQAEVRAELKKASDVWREDVKKKLSK